MKPAGLRWFIAGLAVLFVGAALAFSAWVISTATGSRWLIAALSSQDTAGMTVKKVEGEIAGNLRLTGIRIPLAQQMIHIETLELRWKPLLLLAGTVAVQQLTIDGVQIQDDTPPASGAPVLLWPQLPKNAHLLDGMITRLQVTNLRYQRLQEPPVQVTHFTGSVTWQDDLISVTDLTATLPSLQLRGSISAGFTQPALTADLAVVLSQPVAEMDRFSLQLQPGKRTGSEIIAGMITLAGAAGEQACFKVTGPVGMVQSGFNLHQLSLSKPGRKGMVTADGSVRLTTGEPVATLQVTASGLDLAPELHMPTDLSGILTLAGTPDRYHGTITLANRSKGWQAASISSAYHGSREAVKLAPFAATLLDGTLAGNLDIAWRNGFSIMAELTGRNLNPGRIDPAWKGVANFRATGTISQTGKAPLVASIRGSLLESRLHGQTLNGELQAHYADNNLTLSRMDLQGKGFDLHAAGDLGQRITLDARVSDLSRLVPGSSGSLLSNGWVRWDNQQLSGAITGSGKKISTSGIEIADAGFSARLDQGDGYPGHVAVSLHGVTNGRYTLNDVTLTANGTLAHHSLTATVQKDDSRVNVDVTAGYSADTWKGTITGLAGKDRTGSWNATAPASFSASLAKLSLSPLILTSDSAERLDVGGDVSLTPLAGKFRVQWSGLNLNRISPYLNGIQVTGRSNGTVQAGFLPGKRLTLAGDLSGNGILTGKNGSITLDRGHVSVEGGERGLLVGMEFHEATGGSLKGSFVSADPLLGAVPEKGKLSAEWNGVDTALLKPWLPADTIIGGKFNGRARGNILPGQRLALSGTALLEGGAFHQGNFNLAVPSASASWQWRDESLDGTLTFSMADYGNAAAHFKLPIPARFPVAISPRAPLQASLRGQLQEQGLFAGLFPEFIQKSFGTVDTRLEINGTWDEPNIGGTLKLTNAGAYLPTAGIHLKDIRFVAQLEKNIIRIDSFRAVSGPGYITGNALLNLSGRQLLDYRGTIRGDNFQVMHLPEFRVMATPDLVFTGTPQKITVRGDVKIPELHLVGSPVSTVITPSGDVIREGIIVPTATGSPLAYDIQIRVLLGERVFVNMAGIEAQLGGAVALSLDRLDSITSRGEITVVKGLYRTYGVSLDIARGRLFFAGGSLSSPTLDFKALRTVGDVKAGVTVAGSLQKPVAKLYSEPAMPDVDVLSYIVLGRPYDNNGERDGLVTQAAGALLTSGQASVVQDQIKNTFGLSTLEIQGGVGAGAGAGAMGYKPLQVTAPGTIPAAMQSGITETVLTVGKYLTPQLYISYGKSLFTGSNLFQLRYDIFKKWQIETQTGSESGVDLFYKFEFK